MRIYVVPAPGRRVRFWNAAGLPAVLPDEGASVEESSFWLRRLQDGDVVIGAPPRPKAARSREQE